MKSQSSQNRKPDGTSVEQDMKVLLRETRGTEHLSEALRRDSIEADAWVKEGEKRLMLSTPDRIITQDMLDGAADCFEKALAVNPECVTALVRRGEIYHIQGTMDEAITIYMLEYASECFEKALDIDSRCVGALIGAGQVSLRWDRFGEAAQYFRKAIDICPKISSMCADAFYKRGSEHFTRSGMRGTILQNQLEKAIKCFEKVLDIEPKNIAALIIAGTAALILKKPDDARDFSRRAMIVDPDSEDAYKIWHASFAIRPRR